MQRQKGKRMNWVELAHTMGEKPRKDDRRMSNEQFLNDPAMKEYFNSLPPLVKESIKQSGAELCSLQEMKNFANQLLEQKSQG